MLVPKLPWEELASTRVEVESMHHWKCREAREARVSYRDTRAAVWQPSLERDRFELVFHVCEPPALIQLHIVSEEDEVIRAVRRGGSREQRPYPAHVSLVQRGQRVEKLHGIEMAQTSGDASSRLLRVEHRVSEVHRDVRARRPSSSSSSSRSLVARIAHGRR